jgi:hypothetical protein
MIRDIIGQDGFIWSFGVVEDRFDPLYLGRCKVRWFSDNPESKEDCPTDELPWSYRLGDLDSGCNVVGPKEGDWVFGFYKDGLTKQEPVIVGRVFGFPERLADPKKGFYDPRPDSVLSGHQVPRKPDRMQQYDTGHGNDYWEQSPKSRFPDKNYLEEPDSNRYERGYTEKPRSQISKTVVPLKLENIDIGQRDVDTADHDAGTGTDVDSPGGKFSEPETPFNPKYPYNHVYFSESGHFTEVDDTPDFERLHWYHRVGTFKEIHPVGTTVEKIVDSQYHIVLETRFTHIEASDIQTVDWGKKVYVNKDGAAGNNYDQTVGPGSNFNITVKGGKMNIHVHGDYNLKCTDGMLCIEVDDKTYGIFHDVVNIQCDKDVNINVDGNLNAHVSQNANVAVDGDYTEYVGGDKKIYIGGDEIKYVGGSYTRTVKGSVAEMSLGSTERGAISHITDHSIANNCYRTGIQIADTAAICHHNSFLTNCFGYLLGFTIDSDGDTTPAGPFGPADTINVSSIVTGILSAISSDVTDTAQENISEALETLLSAISDSVKESNAEATEASESDSTTAGSAAGGGSGGGGGGGYNGPTNAVFGDGFLWKPVSESTGKLVVLTPDANGAAIYTVRDGKRGTLVETGSYSGVANGGRAHYRFSKPGSGYGPDPVIVLAGSQEYLIPKPAERYE